MNLGLFDVLVNSEGPQSLAQLANKTGADPVLLGTFHDMLYTFLIYSMTDHILRKNSTGSRFDRWCG